MAEPPPVLALVGPTAAGKSAVALSAATRLGAEIVAVDAFTVYRGMDIGTAKPAPSQRRAVPHHLVDALEPSAPCTVQWFQQAARAAIDAIHARGRAPLLVGGSGLYFRAVVDPLEFPPTDPAVRARLQHRHAADPRAAWEELRAVDPDAAARIDPANLRRTVRALEVRAITGRQFSTFARAWDSHRSIYPGLTVVGLDPGPDEVRARVERRLQAMVAAGWVRECRRLLAGPPLSDTARRAIGYAELFAHLEGRQSLDEALAQAAARTRRYAARQRRWFRSDPRVCWSAPEEAADRLAASSGRKSSREGEL